MHAGHKPTSASSDQFSDNADPKCTVRLLDTLVIMGLTDNAFALLHHKKEKHERETINGFRSYCLKTATFRIGSNRLVRDRLLRVLNQRLASSDGSVPGRDFETLADRAYKDIPSR